MKAIILAAGRGSRMMAETESKPKVLMEFAGKTLLDWQVSVLREAGIQDIQIVCGYHAELFSDLGFPLWQNPRWHETNMVHSLMCARPMLEKEEQLIVTYGDIIYEPRVLDQVLNGPRAGAVAVDRKWLELWQMRSENPMADAESLRMDSGNNIIEIGRKKPDESDIEGQYIGLMRFSGTMMKALLKQYDSCRKSTIGIRTIEKAYMTDFLQTYIDGGNLLPAVEFEGGWLEFDTDTDLAVYTLLQSDGSLHRFVRLESMP